jgi:serine/threonine protein kinase
VNSDEYEQSSIVCSETEFPRNCGFCKHKFDSRQDRIDHIAGEFRFSNTQALACLCDMADSRTEHFKEGKCMLDWSDDSDDDSHDSDNNDDDDDDKPSGDGYDGASSHPPPESDPRDNFDSNYYGGGDYGGGGSSSSESQLPSGSFFQFQSSPKPDNVDITKQQHIQQRPQSSSKPEEKSSLHEHTSTEQCSMHEQCTSTARDDQTSLAGDALSGLLVGEPHKHSQHVQDSQLGSSDRGKDVTGRNTLNSPTESTTLQTAKDQGEPASSTVLDSIQNFTPQSFLSVRLLGAGGFSTVDEVLHRATNLRLGRKTLKNRDPTAIEELKKEVSVLQKLRHPHVIRFLGAYSKGDKMSILVSPVAETTLALWLEQATLQNPANLVNVISKMFGCLVSSIRYLHEQRPVVKHMDIKPQNILVAHGDQEFPRVVLCDFGISSSEDNLSDGQHKPLTRRYVAPEVFEGFTRKQAADIWSLGCVFAEMASAPFSQSNSKWLSFRREYSGRTGKHYWQDVPSLQDKLSSFLEEAATPTEQVVVDTLKSMLNADPNERPSAALLSLKFTPAPCCLEWPNDKAVFPNPDQELEAVEMLVHQDGIDCCDRLDHPTSVTDNHSRDVFKNAKNWLGECTRMHEACRIHAVTDMVLPTRLVDTQPDGVDSGAVRIVDSASIDREPEPVKYATLSYVWGQKDVTLTTDRLQNAQLGLQRQQLSKPLESGIQAAQHLGYRYIWVDSLCIVQDSEDDKRSECTRMASVYRNSALTIVLDQIDKIRSERPAIIEMTPGTVLANANANVLIHNVSAVNVNETSDRLSASASLPTSDFSTVGFGWDTRAWALQERLLSHRFLHLCDKQLYWECNSLKASDTFPRGLSSLVWEKAHSKSRHDSPQRGKSGSQSVMVKNALDTQTPLEPTRLRNCQWVHKEGDSHGDSMTAAHTTLQPADCTKVPLSSPLIAYPESARKPTATATATPAARCSTGAFNAGSGPWTGTSTTRPTCTDGSTSPYLKGLFTLSSLADTSLTGGTAHSPSLAAATLGDVTTAHPTLTKVYRGSENSSQDVDPGLCPGTCDTSTGTGNRTGGTITGLSYASPHANTSCTSLANSLAHQLAATGRRPLCASPTAECQCQCQYPTLVTLDQRASETSVPNPLESQTRPQEPRDSAQG